MTKKLFGGSSSRSDSSSVRGFDALPNFAQNLYRSTGSSFSDILSSPEQFFSPIGLTPEEQLARTLIDPANLQGNISQFLNPFQSIIQEDINRQFRAPQSALASRASEAGAFGGSRFRDAQSDLERARLDALARSSADQYSTAFNQLNRGISSLLGFGQLERGVDLAQRGALPSAIRLGSGFLSPLLTSGTTQSSSASDMEKGIIPGLSGFFGGGS